MMEQDFEKQHEEIYMRAMNEFMVNNTKSLVENDLLPLFQTPPLETMDTIKQKLLSYAKMYEIVLNTNEMNEILKKYRIHLQDTIKKLGEYREKELQKKLEKEKSTFKLLKKDLMVIDRKIKKEAKETMINSADFLLDDISKIVVATQIPIKFSQKISNFLKIKYPKQILESMDMKILVKDTILMNGIKEQTERFQFTKENSHLFD